MTLAVCPECGGTFAGTDRFCQRDGARLLEADEDDPLLGQAVGSYRIAALLGAGGMGRVYLGVHPTIGSRVAIKVLSRDSSGRRDLIDRFFAEAQVVNRIRHEGIVNVLDLASLPDGRPYIVMELLSGEPLAAMLARLKQLDPAHAVAIALPLLDALAAAHDQGVVHRDLKPDNVFVTRQGRVVVLDFGIAKLLPDGQAGAGAVSPSTRTGAVLGTPGYMSPEQIHGRATGPAADLYSVGVLLYQALVGSLPFDADGPFEMMQKHVSAAPSPMRNVRPEIPPALDAVVMRALAKDPRERFAGARAMAQALAASLTSTGGGDVDAAAARRTPAARRALIGGLALGAAAAAAIVLIAALMTRAGREEESEGPAVAQAGEPAAGQGTRDAGAQPATEQPATAADASIPAPDPGQNAVAGGPPRARRPRSSPASPSHPPGQSPPVAPAAPPASTTSAPGATASAVPTPTRRPGVTQMGGVTITNTAEQARAMTGLDKISAPLATRGGSFDPMRTLTQATALARRLMPDAVLVGLDIDHARPDGSALIRVDSGASYRFRSPSRSKRPADLPRNVEVDIPCMVHVWAQDGRLEASPVTSEDCDARPLRRPTCPIAALWTRARAEGAPRTGDWVARISYLPDGWFIDIPRAGKPPTGDFSLSLPDTCP